MKKYRYTYQPDQIHFPTLAADTLFIDIETTGFDRRSTFLTIIGLAWMENGEIVIEQWFNETGAIKEPILLMELEKLLCQKDFPTLVHYNGTTFDLPYLKTKYEIYHLPTSIVDCPSVDLYRVAKKYRDFLNLNGLKQKNLEEYLGLIREDSLSGQELIAAYLEGIKFQDRELIDMYLLHNKEDMEGMVFLQNLLKLDGFLNGDFEVKEWIYSHKPNIVIKDSTSLSIKARGDFYLDKPLSFSFEGIHITLESGQALFQIPVIKLEAKYFYTNYKDYFYLPLEDRAIHKSVAAFVEKDFRKKATKETCYIRKTAAYLPFPLPENTRLRKECLKECCELELFYAHYGDSMAYVNWNLENEACRKMYLKTMLNSLI